MKAGIKKMKNKNEMKRRWRQRNKGVERNEENIKELEEK
jgi:hypothetical protein